MPMPASETGITGPIRAPAPPAGAPGGRGRRLWVELVTVFGVAPALLALAPRWLVSVGIIGSGAVSLLVLLRDPTFSRSLLWRGGAAARTGLRGILRRTVLVWTALFAFTVLRRPDHLFDLPLGRPRLWLMVLLVYPVLSAYSQELMFRTWFYHRYAALFRHPLGRVLASGLAFGWAHIVVHDATAMVLATLGGILFASTYERHRSTLLVALEHALYGDFVFTIGLGGLFYTPRHGISPWVP